MNKSDLLLLLDYTTWANRKLFAAAAHLSPEQFIAPFPCTYGSLRAILVHMLVAYQVWLSRCQTGRLPASLPEHAEIPDLPTFIARFEDEQAAMRAYIGSLFEQDLIRPIAYSTSKGVDYTNTLWTILVHLVNHTTQHRSEAAELLTSLGCSPGDMDLIWYLRETGR